MNMKRRHSGHMGSGGSMHSGHRRPQNRYSSGGYNQHQKPRKNYSALREKYLNMAKEAMSSGDRVLAEYYLQHADHYYRMQQEYYAERAARQQQEQPGTQEEMHEEAGEEEVEGDVSMPNNSNVLPAFLTRQIPPQTAQQQEEAENKVATSGGWEEEN